MTQELMQDPMDPTGRHLRIVSKKPGPDLAAAERAAEDFLTALGVDLGGDGLAQTPARMARAYAELFDAMTSAN
jgi:GTP cyclohydrolase I